MPPTSESSWGTAHRSGLWTRVSSALFWIAPPLLCLAIYRHGLQVWFTEDDFVWLGLLYRVHSWSDLWKALFTPTVDGTLRPLGERGFFLAFHAAFGLNPLPARLCVFLTQFANLVLIGSLARRLTGLRAAGFWAPLFWISNSALATVMTWTTSYMHVLCGFLLLLAFHFFLRYIETGRRVYRLAQWAPFLVGFGVLETSLVYPALAAAYTLLCARKHFRSTLPLFVASALFAVAHLLVAPKVSSGPYSLHLDRFLPHTLWTYWKWALVPTELDILFGVGRRPISISVALLTLALLGFTAWKTWRKQPLPLLFLAWFVILLLPVLPLQEHKIPYYLTLPTIGLAMLGGYAVACAQQQSRIRWKAAAAFLAALYLLVSAPAGFQLARSRWQSSLRVKNLVLGVAEARRLHPGKVILLSGIEDRLFWQAIFNRPFLALDITDVYLAPGSELPIRLRPGVSDISSFVLPAGPTVRGLERGRILVYAVHEAGVRDITDSYYRAMAPRLKSEEPRRVDAVNDLHEYLLGSGWSRSEGTHRWMGRRATLRIAGPRSAAEKLHVLGYCASAQLRPGPLEMTVAVNGKALAPVPIRTCEREFLFQFALPPESVGQDTLEIAVEVNRTITVPGDSRELGLMFGLFEIK